ncbi:hypothetical protein A3C23_01315 [Candidatus Roizmanbacteria bacterium RIFCSPHIGHO2_02_FULL_37_13b]|uniref:Haloacid dehalogenase n=1 Tax=Candidatus Roizmanbacteria bacterium RIFCSPLOWO2_02_FULL_36_11 TaxID=1802071 RepID=A0A1F7JHE8_9BACT|nr:MAG: hypothetical protein A3C23_01315 [Candidatus Roizmanbacteria bacterium RIFCSPHIGHO2_02_FULL_37_13b]OGK55022.1 MAG: hypothetical protein A3H78_00920 [Candidatus Roizmanbacteria bacterium RIFCSPLOWO2_02_FULL_36_11]
MKQNKIKFIYFDVGGVIVNWRIGVDKFAKQYQKKLTHVFSTFNKYDSDFCRGLYPAKKINEIFRKEYKIKDKLFDFHDYVINRFVPIKEVHDLIKDLDTEYRLGLLTNLHPGSYQMTALKNHLPKINFEIVIQSCEVGFIKPEKEIYLLAREKAGVKHEEILFIDDIKINVEEAAKLGWNVVHFDENNAKSSVSQIRRILSM